MVKGTVFLNAEEVKFLFKVLLNMDHNNELRTSIFKKIEQIYLNDVSE